MKHAYDSVTLYLKHWAGEPAEIGDELVTSTGRRYEVMNVRGQRHDCIVLPPHAVVTGTQHNMCWNKRRKITP